MKKRGAKEDTLPDFSLDNVFWTPKPFIEKLKVAKKGEVIILDESMILSNKASMSEMNRAVVIMMSMIRSKQIFVIFNANSIFDIDKNLPLHRADMLVHLYAIDDKFASRGRYFVVPSAKGKLKYLYISGKKYYDYSKAWPAFRDHFSAWFPFDDNDYEKRKQKAINSYFETENKPIYNRMAIARAKFISLCHEQMGITYTDLGKLVGNSPDALSQATKVLKEQDKDFLEQKWKGLGYPTAKKLKNVKNNIKRKAKRKMLGLEDKSEFVIRKIEEKKQKNLNKAQNNENFSL